MEFKRELPHQLLLRSVFLIFTNKISKIRYSEVAYSYYAVPVKGNKKEVLVTSYMTNRGFASGPNKRSTMAPAFLVRIDGDTIKVENIATAQGDWVYDKKSKRKSMIAKNIRGAHLKGEPIDHSLLKNA